MRKNTQGREERPRGHSYAAPPRSPTLTADSFRQKNRMSQSLSSTWSHRSQTHKAEKQTTSSPDITCNTRNQQPEDRTETESTNGDEIVIMVKYCDDKKTGYRMPVRRSCTIEEYMKWKYILHSPNHLDQFNVCIEKELDVPITVTSDSVVHIWKLEQNVEGFGRMCDCLVEFAINGLGKGLLVTETDLQSDQVDMCISALGIHAETLQGHVYCVFMNRDHKKVAEFIERLVHSCPEKEKVTTKKLDVSTIWCKVAELVKLENVLKEHCLCPELKVTFRRYQEKFTLTLNGPERAVTLAEQEFNSLNQRLQFKKCDVIVTAKNALSELQVEEFLDDHLSSSSIRCVASQRKDKIFVYGFSDDCLSRAMKEVESVIIERTCTIRGHLKQRKDLLFSYLKSRWPGKIVVHIEESGFLHIVGVKQYVDETLQILSALNNGKLKLDELNRMEIDDVVDERKIQNVPLAQLDVDQEEVRNPDVDVEEETAVRRKEVNNLNFNKSSEESDAIRKAEYTDMVHITDKGTDIQLNATDNKLKEIAEGNMTLAEISIIQKNKVAMLRQKEDDRSGIERLEVDEDRTVRQAGEDTVVGQTEGDNHYMEPAAVPEGMLAVQGRTLTQTEEDSGQTKEQAYGQPMVSKGKLAVQDTTLKRTGDEASRLSGKQTHAKKPEEAVKVKSAVLDKTTRQTEQGTATRHTVNDAGRNKRNETFTGSGPSTKEVKSFTECIKMSDPKIKQFMVKSEARTFLNTCANENDVVIQQHIDHDSCAGITSVKDDITMIPMMKIERKVTWQTTEKKKMILAINGAKEDGAATDVRSVSVIFKAHKRNKEPISTIKETSGGVIVEVHVPDWINGQGQDKEQLMGLLSRFINVVEEAKVEHVILPLEAVHNWPDVHFIQCVIKKTVQDILLNPKSRKPHTVTLSLGDEEHFDQTFRYTRTCIHNITEANKAKQNQLKVFVISGVLDKTKSDVIVNTTSKDLELSSGRVSATLLKAAGSSIQKECRSKYPEGISRLEVAVTGGHKLLCEKVFHIALDRYQPQKEMNCIETIRSLMITCLKKASELKLKTIAFPAIGTGILKYPIDLVAAAMFESVERFKNDHADTSLTTVFFVIYPTDVRVMEVFQKNEETLGKLPDDKKNKGKDFQLQITGLPNNVQKTKSDVLDRFEDEVTDPFEICEQAFPGVTRQDYVALCEFYKEDAQALKINGIDIRHQQSVLRLSGRRKNLKRASLKIKEHLENILKLHCATLSVQCYSPTAVEREINQHHLNKEVVCVYDKYYDIIYIYAHSSSTVVKVRNMLKDRLSQEELHNESTVREILDAVDVLDGTEKVLNNYGDSPDRRSDIMSVDGYSGRNGTHVQQISERNTTFQDSDHPEEGKGGETKIIDKHGSSSADINDTDASKQCLRTQLSRTRNAKHMKIFQTDNIVVKVYEADILSVPVDCIVNPANQDLNHCGGLAFTIAKAAGDDLARESGKIVHAKGGPLPVTSVVSTTAGQLNFKCILHAVGPCWHDYTPITEESLKKCLNDLRLTVISCFIKAEQLGIKTIALSTISSGLFGVPKELCAIQYANALLDFSSIGTTLKEVHIVDINHDMIGVIHDIFTAMIKNQVQLNMDTRCYLTETAQTREGTLIDKRCAKNTGRDKQKSQEKKSEEAQSKEKIESEEPYVSDGIKLVCRFSPNHCVLVYEGDILELQGIHALICSDNRYGEAAGEVSKQLVEINGKEYETEKAEQFKMKRNYGDVITTDGGKSNFKHIMHAITPTKDKKALHMMYIKLFDEVRKKEIDCIALPLLGTGTGHFEAEESAVIFLSEWTDFTLKYKRHPLTIHLVLNDKETAELVKEMFKEHFDDAARLNESLEKQPLPTKHDDKMPYDVHHAGKTAPEKDDEDCVICMEKVSVPKKLKCGHQFCTDCIDGYFRVKQVCPICGQVCGIVTGNQPDGRMEIMKIRPFCAGYEGHKSIAVSYYFPPGNQGEDHPRPGAHYRSISRTGYLPDNTEGREICAMLKVAFERRLVFTIGTSRTTGEEGVITWNDIHHKTDMRPNTQFGYPDESYLQRVREEIEIKGVTSEDIDKNFVTDLEGDSYRRTFSTDTSV